MAASSKVKSRRLTIFLMREDVCEFDDAIEAGKPSEEAALADSSGVDGRFYYVAPRDRVPDWVPYVAPLIDGDLGVLHSSSTSGLLLIRVAGRIFALTFGYGRSLLDLSRIEHQFGLRVVLNRVHPQQLRSMDKKTFEDMVVTTSTQVSQDAELPAFGINVGSDILRSATGTPKDDSAITQMSGADALVANVKVPVLVLPDFCSDLLEAFGEDAYKEDFEWIDQLALVRDEDMLEKLDNLLVADLTSGNTASTHLAVPEAINWEDIDAFKIAGARDREYEDLDLDAYLHDLGPKRSEITIQRLQSRKVQVRFGRNDTFDNRWKLYNCIVSEQGVDGLLYVLIEGRWFAVEDSLVNEVDSYMSALPEPDVELPDGIAGEPEAEYNKRLVASAPTHLLLFDRKIMRPGRAASGIEFCDVLTDKGELIHVKRKSVSATLSHLFAQGSVSATTFFRDEVFREAVRDHIRAEVPDGQQAHWLELMPARREDVHGRDYTVTYVVVANSKKDGVGWLPFFSKLNLMQHGHQLDGLGVRVALARVSALPRDGDG